MPDACRIDASMKQRASVSLNPAGLNAFDVVRILLRAGSDAASPMRWPSSRLCPRHAEKRDGTRLLTPCQRVRMGSSKHRATSDPRPSAQARWDALRKRRQTASAGVNAW